METKSIRFLTMGFARRVKFNAITTSCESVSEFDIRKKKENYELKIQEKEGRKDWDGKMYYTHISLSQPLRFYVSILLHVQHRMYSIQWID